MSKLTGVALLLSGIGISIYSLSAVDISNTSRQTIALSTDNGSEQNRTLAANQTRPIEAREIASKRVRSNSYLPAAAPGSYSAKRPLLGSELGSDAAKPSAAPRILKQAAHTKRADQTKQPWWQFSLPSWDTPPKKVAIAQLKPDTGKTARVKPSPHWSQSGKNAQIDANATDSDANLLDDTAPDSRRQIASTKRSTERDTARATEREVAQSAGEPSRIIVPTLIATVGEATTTSEETGFDQLRPADEQARYLLTKNLQKELTRVGCYSGIIDGRWGPASRRAMRNFTDQVKATLPVSEPDYILLTLVQGHSSQACSLPCNDVNGSRARQRCTEEGLIFATKPSQRKARLAVQSPPLLAPPLPERPTTVSRKPLIALNKRKPSAATRELTNADPAAIALPTRRASHLASQLAGRFNARSTSRTGRDRQLASQRSRNRQTNRIARAARKAPLPGRMTIGAHARAAQLQDYDSEGSSSITPRIAPAPRLRDDQFSSRFQLGNRGALIRSPTSRRSITTQTEVARIRAEARAAVKQARALAETKIQARPGTTNRSRIARKRNRTPGKPKYFVGAPKSKARKSGPSAARIRAWKRKAWKRTFYKDQAQNSR